MGLFQALIALPAMFILGECAMIALFEPKIPIYDFMLVDLCHSFTLYN